MGKLALGSEAQHESLKGKRYVKVTEFKTKRDWARFVKRIADEWYPKSKKLKLVLDNFKTHDLSAFYETFEPAEAKRLWDRFELYTPKHGSWLNLPAGSRYGRNRITCIKWSMPQQAYIHYKQN